MGKKLVSLKGRRLSSRFKAGQDASHRSGDYGAGGWALGLGPPCLPLPYFRPLACDVHPVVYEEVSRDHGLVSGQHNLLQEVRAKVLLHPGILERERAKRRGGYEARALPGRLPTCRGPQSRPSPQLQSGSTAALTKYPNPAQVPHAPCKAPAQGKGVQPLGASSLPEALTSLPSSPT